MGTFNHNRIDNKYVCKCGKEFWNSQKFNAHKSNCRTYLLFKTGSDELYNSRIKLLNDNRQKALDVYKQNCLKRKQEKEKKWNEEPHFCERCGLQIKEKIGSGRFCSTKCMYSRIHTEQNKRKISESLLNHYAQIGVKKEKICCKRCGKQILATTKTKLCSICYKEYEKEKSIGKYNIRPLNEPMNYLWENYPAFDCDKQGNVYKNGIKIIPFKSNKYLQICLYDKSHKKRVVGIHTIVAMKYLNYYEGCVVHHIDENTYNNCIDNLEIISRGEHTKLHAKLHPELYKGNAKEPWNKGKKMSEEYCKKCSEGAKKRYSKKS